MIEEQDDEAIVLGGNIVLSGFNEVDGASMIILKKLIGNHVRRISDQAQGFEQISITMKTISNSQFEVHGKVMDSGQQFTAEHQEHNLFITVDTVLKKLHNAMSD